MQNHLNTQAHKSNGATTRSMLAFFLIAGALYAPVAYFADVEVFPKVALFNIAAFIPVTVALILVFRDTKFGGVQYLLRRAIDFRRIESKFWYIAIFLLYPGIVFIQYGLALVSEIEAPSPIVPIWMPLIMVAVFIAAAGEELGWMGYLFNPMEERFGTFYASVFMGIVWAAFHIPLFTSSGASPSWIGWQLVYITLTRVLFVWVYSNTAKSVFAVIAMHTTFNLGWQFFPPSAGLLVPSFYNPRNLALTTFVILAIVLYLFGPSMVRYRYAKRGRPQT